MTQGFKDLLYLLRSALHEEKEMEPLTCDVPTILSLAQKQQIALIIFPALKTLFEQGKLEASKENFAMLEGSYLSLVTEEIKRRFAISKMATDLTDAGFFNCLLKGAVVADLYPVPEARVSGDSDFYIDKKYERAINAFMKEKGFEVLPRPKTSHHAMAKSKQTGLVEFHLSLYDALFEDVWFDHPELLDHYRSFTTKDGYTYQTLGVTDHAIFLTLHLIKHFLSEGVGIRQVTDVLLYLRHYRDELDASRFAAFFTKLSYAKFLHLCFTIGEDYLGFDDDDFGYIIEKLPFYDIDEGIVSAVLSDMEQGGVFGHDDETRKRFYIQYTQARFYRFKNGDFETYIRDWHKANTWQKVFPPFPVMRVRFPILQKYPVLLPAVHMGRIFVKYVLRRGRKAPDLIPKEEHSRLNLIRKLDMI